MKYNTLINHLKCEYIKIYVSNTLITNLFTTILYNWVAKYKIGNYSIDFIYINVNINRFFCL